MKEQRKNVNRFWKCDQFIISWASQVVTSLESILCNLQRTTGNETIILPDIIQYPCMVTLFLLMVIKETNL